MSWHYLQELEEEFSEGYSADSKPCAPLKSNHSVGRFSSNVKWMDAYRDSLSEMTCEPSMANRGEDESISLPEGSHAKTSLVRALEKDLGGTIRIVGRNGQNHRRGTTTMGLH